MSETAPCAYCCCEGCEWCTAYVEPPDDAPFAVGICACIDDVDEADRAADDRVAAIQAHVDDAVQRATAELRAELAKATALSVADHLATEAAEEENDRLRAQLDGLGKATEWGEARTEWIWGVRRPDGSAAPLLEPQIPRTEDVVRREFEKVVENMGYRKVLLHRTVPGWREAAGATADGVHETGQENHG